jgi:hypothetical protein
MKLRHIPGLAIPIWGTRRGLTLLAPPGYVIWAEPGEAHWHGATTDTFMTHIAIQEVDEPGSLADWKEQVTTKSIASSRHTSVELRDWLSRSSQPSVTMVWPK